MESSSYGLAGWGFLMCDDVPLRVECPFCRGFGMEFFPAYNDDDGREETAECPYCEGCGDVNEHEAEEIKAAHPWLGEEEE
jgi:hypothetical protein